MIYSVTAHEFGQIHSHSGAEGFKGRLRAVHTHIALTSFSWYLPFVDIDPASNFTHCESQPLTLWSPRDVSLSSGKGGGAIGTRKEIKHSASSSFHRLLSSDLLFNSCCRGRKSTADLKASWTTTCNDVSWGLEEMTASLAVFHMCATSPGGVNLQQLNICAWDAAGNCAKTTARRTRAPTCLLTNRKWKVWTVTESQIDRLSWKIWHWSPG